MNKKQLWNFVAAHRSLFVFAFNVRNRLRFKNKLRAKGCRLQTGLTIIQGLRIVNRGKNNRVILEDFVRMNDCRIVILGDNNTIHIKAHSVLNQVEMHMEDAGNTITVGTHTHLCGKTQLAVIEGTNITIGNDCLFSSDLQFRTGDSHSILDAEGRRINPSEDIVIEDHVWIGAKVTCLKGVRVCKNSIVAATATVSKKFEEENVIIGGLPAKVIKTNVNWDGKRL